MAKKTNVEEKVEELVRPLVTADGFELVDVEFIKDSNEYLRIFIDRPGGVGLDDCQAVSEKLTDVLDSADIVPGSYILEVSSPGLDRVLRKDRDYRREAGKMVDVTLYEKMDGKKHFTAELIGLTEDAAAVELKNFAPIEREKIAQIRLHIDF